MHCVSKGSGTIYWQPKQKLIEKNLHLGKDIFGIIREMYFLWDIQNILSARIGIEKSSAESDPIKELEQVFYEGAKDLT